MVEGMGRSLLVIRMECTDARTSFDFTALVEGCSERLSSMAANLPTKHCNTNVLKTKGCFRHPT